MKLVHTLNTPNHFNKPAYNTYYSGYSNTYQPDNHKCRKGFRDTNARNRLAYTLENLKMTGDEHKLRQQITHNNLRQLGGLSFNECMQNPDIPDDLCSIEDFFKCFDQECLPVPGAEIQDNFRMERDGCRQRQVNQRYLHTNEVCRPKNPECAPYLVEPRPKWEPLPPIYGEWFPVPPEKDPSCAPCPDETDIAQSQLDQAIKNANFGGDCEGSIWITWFTPTSDPALEGFPYKVFVPPMIDYNGMEIPGGTKPYAWTPNFTGADNCLKIGCYYKFCGEGNSIVDFPIRSLSSSTSTFENGTVAYYKDLVMICVVTDLRETCLFSEEKCFIGVQTPAIMTAYIYNFRGSAPQNLPKFPKGTCFHSFSAHKRCPGQPDYNYERKREPSGGAPKQRPEKRKPKENPPECMEACTCEQIEQLLKKYLSPKVKGSITLEPCGKPQQAVAWEGEGFEGLNEAILKVGSGLQEVVNAGLCLEVNGTYQVPLCSDGKSGFKDYSYSGKGLEGLSNQLKSLGEANKAAYLEFCDNQTDIKIEIQKIPEKVQIQLSDDIALIVSKLNQILDKIGKEDSLFERIIQIVTLIATLLGLLNDIRSLLDKQKDYTPDLELLKELTQEIKRLLSGNMQGSIDAIRCDGTINSNSWSGEGLEGLNQAITALGVNIAILHSDLCELLERKTDEIKPPRLQGSVDAIRCDGTISSNSWDGEGFDGLNQAITAIGVNLAILHSDLCELLDRWDEDKDELPLLEGSVDAIRCDGTISSNSWSGRGFDGLNQAITAIGTNIAILHSDLCGLLKDEEEKDNFEIVDKYKCGENEIIVQEKIENTAISRELKFLYERLKRIELLICELEECNAVPVFPGDSIEERNIPAQAVITFVEQKYYPKMSGSKWHVSIPYPKEDLISEQNCWSKFENLIIKKGNVHGTVVWKSPNNTINRFYAGLFGHDENGLREFLERIAGFSRLQKATIRITTGGNPRARPKDVTIQAVKVVVLERDDQGRMVPVKCCRAPKKAGR